jgi:hypothetical protein
MGTGASTDQLPLAVSKADAAAFAGTKWNAHLEQLFDSRAPEGTLARDDFCRVLPSIPRLGFPTHRTAVIAASSSVTMLPQHCEAEEAEEATRTASEGMGIRVAEITETAARNATEEIRVCVSETTETTVVAVAEVEEASLDGAAAAKLQAAEEISVCVAETTETTVCGPAVVAVAEVEEASLDDAAAAKLQAEAEENERMLQETAATTVQLAVRRRSAAQEVP